MLRETIVVVQKGDHSLGYYDLAGGQEVGRVGVDPYPHEFALSHDRHYAYLCHFGVALAEDEGPGGNTVSVVDVPARRRVGTVDCGPWRRPHGIALDDRGTLYVLSEGTGHLLVVSDPLGGQVDRAQPTGGQGSHIVSVTGDGRLAFASNMVSHDVTAIFTDDPQRPPVAFPVGQRPEGSVLDEAGERLYVVARESGWVAVIDVARLELLEPIPTPPGPVRICRGPDGCLLVPLYHDKSLALLNPRDGLRWRVPLPDKPISIGYHAPDALALVSTFGDRLCLVDTAAGRLVRTLATRSDPDPVAVVPL